MSSRPWCFPLGRSPGASSSGPQGSGHTLGTHHRSPTHSQSAEARRTVSAGTLAATSAVGPGSHCRAAQSPCVALTRAAPGMGVTGSLSLPPGRPASVLVGPHGYQLGDAGRRLVGGEPGPAFKGVSCWQALGSLDPWGRAHGHQGWAVLSSEPVVAVVTSPCSTGHRGRNDSSRREDRPAAGRQPAETRPAELLMPHPVWAVEAERTPGAACGQVAGWDLSCGSSD